MSCLFWPFGEAAESLSAGTADTERLLTLRERLLERLRLDEDEDDERRDLRDLERFFDQDRPRRGDQRPEREQWLRRDLELREEREDREREPFRRFAGTRPASGDGVCRPPAMGAPPLPACLPPTLGENA